MKGSCIALGTTLLVFTPFGLTAVPEDHPFQVLQGGQPVRFEPSQIFVAAFIPPETDRTLPVVPPDGFIVDELGARSDLRERGITLFRKAPAVRPKGLEPVQVEPWKVVVDKNITLLPVFESGPVLRIPTGDVLVTFDHPVPPERAREVFEPVMETFGIRSIEQLRGATFVATLRQPARVFLASRAFAKFFSITGAEPDFANLFRSTPLGPPEIVPIHTTREQQLSIQTPPGGLAAKPSWEREPEEPHWKTILDQGFEGPCPEWFGAWDPGGARVVPFVTTYRAHRGTRSVYMSGDEYFGRRPPGPYVENALPQLIGATFDAGFTSEAFFELWFWAVFEDSMWYPRLIRDFGIIHLRSAVNGETVFSFPIAPSRASGNLAGYFGTENGWQRILFRIPKTIRDIPLYPEILLVTDGSIGAEGLYIDDIRVLGMTSYPQAPPGAPVDPFTVVQWAIMTGGQIAGRPAKGDPSAPAFPAWAWGGPDEDLIVALLDDGVEIGHPDLTLVDLDGTVETPPPGIPVDPGDRHGTACAGVLGAKAGQKGEPSVGICGTAPGARILSLLRGVDDASIVRAIDDAVRFNARVLVIPWGWFGPGSSVIEAALLDAVQAGLVVITAAGDANVYPPFSDDLLAFPCRLSAHSEIICVGASGPGGDPKSPISSDGHYWWSSAITREGPDLLAPGTWLHATDRRGPLGYGEGDWIDNFEGTGAAACAAGGIAALVVSKDPQATPRETKQLLMGTSIPVSKGTAHSRAVGLIQPEAAVHAAVLRAEERAKEAAAAAAEEE